MLRLRTAPFKIAMLMLLLSASSCMLQRKSALVPRVKEKTLVSEYDRGWLRYKVYLMPDTSTHRSRKSNSVFSIMIINMENATSPLRRLCANLGEYNVNYEYLLNQTKNDVVLMSGSKVQYPIYYAFENNYNAFPFETINVGYPAEMSRRKKNRQEPASIVYIDKTFAHDTVRCNLSFPQSL